MVGDSIRVGAQRYAIVRVDDLATDNDDNGQTLWAKSEFRLDSGLCGDAVLLVLLHEVQHAALYNAGVREDKHNEVHIDIIAAAMLQLFRDNPGLFAEG